jgi:biopolymer transport protein ExbD
MVGSRFPLGGLSSDTLVGRNRHKEMPEFDITAMVDLVFMMNIYFMVTFITAALAEIPLPTASHVEPLIADEAVMIKVLGTLDGKSVTVSLGDDADAPPVTEIEAQNDAIAAAVEKGKADGKKAVLIKAEKKVKLGDLFRVATAASGAELRLNVAVVETEADR